LATKQKKLGQKAPQNAEPTQAKLERLARELNARLLELKANTSAIERDKPKRTPGRFKGALAVGPEFFEPLTEDELKEFTAE
jgi:hypothetical protein